jgi:hypothetical protein
MPERFPEKFRTPVHKPTSSSGATRCNKARILPVARPTSEAAPMSQTAPVSLAMRPAGSSARPQITPRFPLMKGHGTKFPRKKEVAIAALLTQKNHEEAARVAGINLKTLKSWMRLPEFMEEYRRARWEVVEQAYARAQQNTGAATAVLMKLMVDSATPPSARIRAALGLFGIAREGFDLDIEARVSALERAAEESKKAQ